MRKVLFIITKSEIGGAQKWVKEQIDIVKDEFEVYLATDENGWLVKNSNVKDIFLDFNIRKRLSITYLFKLIAFFKKNNIDLIIASSANAGIYARLSKLFYKTSVIYVGHGWSSVYNGGKLKWFYTSIEKLLSYLTDSILCVSQSDYNRAKNDIGINTKKLKLIKNSIYPMKPRIERNERLKILTVARFRYPKRNDLLVKAMKNIDADLYIVGDGPLKKEVEKIAPKNVFFLGEVDGFNEFYKYDIFVLISESEGLPLSAIEAMSAGLPLVLSNVGGCPELIDGNGVLVENDDESIKNGINKAILNKEIFSLNSRVYFNNNYNLNINKNKYLNYYKCMLSQSNCRKIYN